MNELRRLVITDQDGLLTIVVRPNKNRLLTLLMGGWTVGALVLTAAATYVLRVGRFPVGVWVFYGIGLGAMVLGGACVIFWNVSFTKVIRFAGDTVNIEGNGLRRRRELLLGASSGFRLVGPRWPYNVDMDYEFLGLGLWGLEAYGPGGVRKLITRMNRDTASVVARALCAKGFRVDAPFPLNGQSAHA